MTTTFTMGALPFWYVADNQGTPLERGTLYSGRALAPNEPKAIYQDAAGIVPYANPLQALDNGSFPPLFFANDEAYYLRFVDGEGNERGVVPNYIPPGAGGTQNITVVDEPFNHVFNGQLNYAAVVAAPVPMFCSIAPGWFFKKSNTAVTDSITAVPFILGQTDVERNPLNYIEYNNTNVGSGGETYKYFYQRLGRVSAFSGEQVTLSLFIKSSLSSTVTLQVQQFFGNGGTPSPTVVTTALSYVADNTWQKAQVTFTVPSVSGKTIGTMSDDALYVLIGVPLNAICTIGFTNVLWVEGDTSFVYPFRSDLDPYVYVSPWFVGEFKILAMDVVEDQGKYAGWLKLNLATSRLISRVIYQDLFLELGTVWSEGDGSTTFGLPPGGRVLVGASAAGSGITARNVGDTFGEERVVLSIPELPAHAHPSASGGGFTGPGPGPPQRTYAGGGGLQEVATTGNTGLNLSHENQQPSISVCVLIRYRS
jgi:hypothetical protein